MATTGKTAAELQDLIMDGLRDHPECKDIVGVVVAADDGLNWRVIAITRGGRTSAPTEPVDAVAARLRQQYHLMA
jgi:hypothetical protein